MPRCFSSGALSIDSNDRTAVVPPTFSASTFVIEAVRVVLPWSMWPIVPTLTCGLVRAKTSLAIVPPQVHCEQPDVSARTTGVRVIHKDIRELLLGLEPKNLLITNEVLYH